MGHGSDRNQTRSDRTRGRSCSSSTDVRAPGSFLQPGIKLTVDQGSPMQIPYVICLTNGCVAGSVANASFIHDLEAGQMLALETVNSNVLGVTNSLPLKDFAEVRQGAPAQVFEQRLEGDWEQLGR